MGGVRTTRCIGSVSPASSSLILCYRHSVVLREVDADVNITVPIISLVPFGIGIMGIFGPLQVYMVDCFPQYAASAIAGMTCLRCLFGGLLPLAGPSMYDSMGLGWGNSMLGFVAIAFIPIPALLFKYGKAVRERYPISF